MARYQIRTEEYLEDIITKMADHSWLSLRTWQILEFDGTSHDFINFRNSIRDAIAERVRTYKLCGVSDVCSDHVKSTQWSANSHLPDRTAYDRIYHVFPKTDMEDFLTEITAKSLPSIVRLLKADHEDEACTMLRAVFKLILSDYLFLDPICGQPQLCAYSTLAPVSIWQKKNDHGELEEEF
jgi:hypothetical protein